MDTSYLKHFKLVEMPYKLSPDPRFLFMTPQHEEAIAKVQYVIGQKGGLVAVYGSIGMGKTTIARRLNQILTDDPNYQVAMLVTPALKTETAFLRAIMEELEVQPKRSYHASLTALQDAVLAARLKISDETPNGVTTVIIIDEAQKLTPKMLDVVHSLHNFESDTEKLLQLVLIGQNELADNLDKVPEVADRVAVFANLPELTQADSNEMIAFRWHTASGGKSSHPFNAKALEAIYTLSRGLPRITMKLCDLALLQAMAEGKKEVTAEMILDAAKDLRIESRLAESVAV